MGNEQSNSSEAKVVPFTINVNILYVAINILDVAITSTMRL